MIKLILTRHGETLENRRDMMQGHIPGVLSPQGIEQAYDLAGRLADTPVDHIVSSDLARSFDTAKIVGDAKKMDVRPEKLLREIDWGENTGGRLSTLDWRALPPGSETLLQLMERGGRFIEWIRAEYPGKTVLAVGHGAINRAILAWLEGKDPEEMLAMPIMKNTSCVELEI